MSGEPFRKTVEVLQAEGVLLVEDGNHGEYRPRPEEFSDQGEAFIRAADMDDGVIHFDTCSRINSIARSRIRKGIGAPRDILLSHKGTVGKLARVQDDCEPFVCSPQTTFWRVLDSSRIDRDFLFYFMRSWDFANQLKRVQGETDMAPYVSLTAQRRFTIPLPAIGVQSATAGVLSALDGKIELNRRMAATLEGIARAFFESWFVDFDPVRGSDMERSTFSPLFPTSFSDEGLPSGWISKPLVQLVILVRAMVQPQDLPLDTPYVGLEHIPRKRLTLDSVGVASDVNSQKISFEKGDILFGKLRSYFHKVVVAPTSGICSSDILVLRAKERVFEFLVLLAVSSEDFVRRSSAAATGTRMPRADWSQMAAYRIPIPSGPILHRFNEVVAPIFTRLDKLRTESITLAAIRDALLPKLIAGELEVRDAETRAAAGV